MKPNELRIGNYVYRGYFNKIPSELFKKQYELCEVKSLGIERIITSEKIKSNNLVKTKYNQIKPIPITEERLLKLGFKSDNPGYYYYEDIRIFYNNSGLHNYTMLKDGNLIKLNISEVHNLQNIIFALTGKELEYNPQ